MPQLRLLLLFAKDLRGSAKATPTHPYVEVLQGDRCLARSRTADRGDNPAWNEALDLDLDTTDALQLMVYDRRHLHRDEQLGTALVTLDRLACGRHVTEALPLLHGHGSVTLQLQPGEGFPGRRSILSLDSPEDASSPCSPACSHSPKASPATSPKASPAASPHHARPPRLTEPEERLTPPSSPGDRAEWSEKPRPGLWVPPEGLSHGYTMDGVAYDVHRQPECAAVSVLLAPGRRVRCRPGALVSHNAAGDLKVRNAASPAGEGFQQHVLSVTEPTEMLLSPWKFGAVAVLHLDGRGHWFVDCRAFFAGTQDVVVDCRGPHAPRDSAFGYIGMRVSGAGTAFLAAHGAIHRLALEGGEELEVDADHLFAYDSRTEGRCRPPEHRGEAPRVCFTGPAAVYVQTKGALGLGRYCCNG